MILVYIEKALLHGIVGEVYTPREIRRMVSRFAYKKGDELLGMGAEWDVPGEWMTLKFWAQFWEPGDDREEVPGKKP